ncbi:MAG: hypothetical protein ACOYW9_05860 [Deinococcota bacterium]|uniref:Uncharacterized protein n=1 Tax=Allomeiothermus silvanus (strain ATCC 700542 / DSM 9946 / NBRC 106475 / NCIMB 13440 / VI-R2) TaxID=526227 RepID=D7BDL9_ALLS1|nr:hypothetical protein [Allomeiothermus silvanus]ADH64839.1 hypothetical protein Mesil_3001 [Allomeiothermus silvanus DSM 9946]MCL6569229.1 hypothetical protein [Allomeiothermus silvanus]
MTAEAQAVQIALQAYRDCQELEEREYAEQYDEVKRMEDEAPAPDPCALLFNELVEACIRYVEAGGNRADLDLGEYRSAVYRRMDEFRSVQRWEDEGGSTPPA